MTSAEKLAYAKGYNAGVRDRWPAHRPPAPPDQRVAAMLHAARALRDALDVACATFVEDDEFVLTLDPPIAAFDAEMVKWTEWLRSQEDQKGSTS